jgi:hypothetical protein
MVLTYYLLLLTYYLLLKLSLSLVRDGQLMPAFGAARREDATAILCAHTRAKSVFVGALAAAGLVGTFHERCVLSGAANSFRAENGSNR